MWRRTRARHKRHGFPRGAQPSSHSPRNGSATPAGGSTVRGWGSATRSAALIEQHTAGHTTAKGEMVAELGAHRTH
jgi:hypothetical protein